MNSIKFKSIVIILFLLPILALSYDTEIIKINTKDYLIVSEVTYLSKAKRLNKVKEKFNKEKELSSIIYDSKGQARIKSEKSKNINSKDMVLHGATKYYKRRDYKDLLVKEMTYNLGSLNGEVRYYNQDGSVSKIECFLNGVKEGYQLEYDSTGTIKNRQYILGGKTIKMKK